MIKSRDNFFRVIDSALYPFSPESWNSHSLAGFNMGRHYRDLVEGKCFFHEFLNLGHVMFLEDPEQFNRTVLEFVEQYA